MNTPFSCILLFVFSSFYQTQAQTIVNNYPNISGTDISDASYDLYAELNVGNEPRIYNG